MGQAAVRPLGVSRAGALLRADERALVITAGGVFALASAGAAMAQAAADGLFLAEIGRDSLGIALALSSALLAVVLAVAGGLADRLERRRVLGTLAMVSAVVLAGLAALVAIAPAASAWLTYIGGKQLAAATDLAFWVVIAERVDARRSQRLVPILAATGGAGAALGALIVIPLASLAGPRGVLLGATVALVFAGLGAARLPASRRVAAAPANLRALVVRSWTDGARAVGRYPLARHLGLVVAIAGVFGSLAYTSLGFAVAQRGGSASELASVFAIVRGAAQMVTLVLQVGVAPRLLARLGTGRAMLLAPLVAIAAACGLVIAPILALAIATQVSARVMDASIETPAEKLAQTLLPTLVRGRVAGFLDGTAKRAGAVVGGVIAAILASAPLAFYASVAVVALAWGIAARRIARELPGLAIEHVAGEGVDDDDRALDAVDDRALAALIDELASERPERAADVLARLHAQGRVDARGPLVAVAARGASPAVWRALIAVLDQPAEAYGPALVEAAQAATTRARVLAVRAIGLAGGVAATALDQWRDNGDVGVALAAEVAALRLAGEDPLPVLADAIRDAHATSVVDELIAECARVRDNDRTLEAARYLVRAIRRERGDAGARAHGLTMLAGVVGRVQLTSEVALLRSDLLELARERIDRGASQPAPDTSLVSLQRPPRGDAPTTANDAAEIAAALRLLGAISVATVPEADDLRRLARALGEPDDDVRIAAEATLARLGAVAAGELIATAAWGRRRARDRAAALLAELPVTPTAIDRLVDAELDALEQTAAAVAVLREPGDELIARRLDERLREIAHTVLLLVAARRRSQAIAKAAVAWRHARGALERARTLAVIEAALPRALVGRLVEAVDELAPADRAATLIRAGVALPARDVVVRSELAGRDRLSRALVLHALDRAGRSAHRDTIGEAARAEALAADPAELLRRLDEPDELEEGVTDMPSRVETLIALGKVPLLAALTTRQLADVAERARWVTAKVGDVVVGAGDPLDALIVVDDGELGFGDRAVRKGDVVDELACVAPVSATYDLAVKQAVRMIRLERVDFEELVDDVPGLASAVCRALGERARRAEDSAYTSPLSSRL
ncbi:MAG: cyclic nucleotide-binding domain-containing protein [Deltaproteobacteria bacterium]